jgi:hypothetical protein
MIFIIMAIGSVVFTGEAEAGHTNITIVSVSSYMRKAAQIYAEDTIRGTVFR